MATIKPASKARAPALARKERLFEDFANNMVLTLERIENLFDVSGLTARVFGEGDHSSYAGASAEAKERLRTSRAWGFLSQMYDYAVEGVDRIGGENSMSDGTSSLIIDAGEIVALLTGEERRISQEWHDILKMADGRFALEDGQEIDLDRVALLANVDVRTVRNAVSAGALESVESGYVTHESARRWLMGRKGFKPTVEAHPGRLELSDIKSTERFGAFMKQCHQDRAQALEKDEAPQKDPLLDAYPGLTKETLAEAEAGVFSVPLSLAWSLADFYGLPREEFLECVMRVFFPEELRVIRARQIGRLSLVMGGKNTGGL